MHMFVVVMTVASIQLNFNSFLTDKTEPLIMYLLFQMHHKSYAKYYIITE